MSERLDGTAALVTGASSGIGYATALALSNAGAKVAAGARRTDRLESLQDEIAKNVWDYEVYDYNAIDALVYRLRQRIEIDPGNPKYIVTVRGFGYKLLSIME